MVKLDRDALQALHGRLNAVLAPAPLPDDGRCVSLRIQEVQELAESSGGYIFFRFPSLPEEATKAYKAYKAIAVEGARAVVHQWIRVPVGNSNTLTIELWRNASPLHLRFKASLEGVAQLNLSDLIPGELTPTPLTFERVAQESTGGGISSAGDGREEGGGERDEEAGESSYSPTAIAHLFSRTSVFSTGFLVAEAVLETLPPDSTDWDLDALAGPLPRSSHLYAHGAFLGAAPLLLRDPLWDSILQSLERDLRAQCMRLARRGGASQLPGMMTVLENSPVLAAYGIVRAGYAPEAGAKRGGGGGGRALESFASLEAGRSDESMHGGGDYLAAMRAFRDTDDREEAGGHVVTDAASMTKAVNQYGFSPIAVEWDIWLCPRRPGELSTAAIVHGSAIALLVQALFGSAYLRRSGVAQRAGQAVIRRQGMTPAEWLTCLANALIWGAEGQGRAPPEVAHGAEVPVFRGVQAEVTGWRWVGEEPRSCWRGVGAPRVVLHARARGQPALLDRNAIPLDRSGPLPFRVPSQPIQLSSQRGAAGDPETGATGITPEIGELYPLPPGSGDGILIDIDVVDSAGRVFPAPPVHMRDIVEMRGAGLALQLTTASAWAARPAEGGEGWGTQEDAAMTRVEISLVLRSHEWDVLERMHHVTGMSDRECRVCVAALSNPGGLFLDIKSVYSSPADIECFISSLAGIGVETRALMTFQTSQRIAQAPTVFLQHGVWGLESACDAGYIRPGDLVLFNGGSLLNDPDRPGDWSTDEYRQKLIDKLAERGTKDKNVTRKIEAIRNSTRHQVRKIRAMGMSQPWDEYGLVDPVAFLRFRGLAELYGFQAGIYVQETDCSAAFVSAAMSMVANRPDLFPLGFAYGGLANSGLGMIRGHGLAAQEIVNELQGRKRLSRRLKKAIAGDTFVPEGVEGLSSSAIAALAYRFMWGQSFMTLQEQRMVLMILRKLTPQNAIMEAVHKLGGFQRVLIRFFEHYELWSPFTLFETGLVLDHTLGLLRLLRDFGGFASLDIDTKIQYAQFVCGRDLYGWGICRLMQEWDWRRQIHLFAKEALLCILESCTPHEAEEVIARLGGRVRIREMLAMAHIFTVHVPGLYSRRFEECIAHLVCHPEPKYLTKKIIHDPSDTAWCRKGWFGRVFPRLHVAYQYPRSTALRLWLYLYKLAWTVGTYVLVVVMFTTVFLAVPLAARALTPYLSRHAGRDLAPYVIFAGCIVIVVVTAALVASLMATQ